MKRNIPFKCLLLYFLFFLLLFLNGCAPKKIKVYDTGYGIRNEVINHAFSLMGRPYKNGAKGPDSFDCSGLIHYVFGKVNINLPPATEGQIKVGVEIKREDVLPGDLVFFRIKKELHAGIMLNKNDFIHASKTKGVTVDHIDYVYWKKSLLGFRSIL